MKSISLNKISKFPVSLYSVSIKTFIAVACCLGACNLSSKRGPAPDEHRFKKIVLAEGLINPVSLDFDNSNRIYIAESAGSIRIFDQKTGQIKKAGFLPTYDGGEFGITGMRLDSHFDQNGFIYLHFFLKDTARIERISRFTIKNDSLYISSEKAYLNIPHENTCCHTAGDMKFDKDGNLYVATGDNTDAFYTHYALTDDRAGHLFDDALRSAGNTNDYRGKILRFHPEPDGGYTIPEGNLFPKGMDSARSEIYIMGVRNPYRITIDPATNYLYWGEVGPDADKDSTRGPKGYDEFNRARKAGYFGWPLFIGNNQAYNHVYFSENERIGQKFDTAYPVNFSRNNTGLKNLPAAQSAFMWYPYDSSEVFPSFGTGGRVAISGPIYHYDAGLDSKIKFPRYFDHCWFIADWMRNWIKTVHLDEHGDRGPIEAFMPHTLFKKPIYMQFGRDGALYLLEFGSSWTNNPDTKLVKIEYISGNRAPVANLQIDKAFGKAPLTVHFSAENSLDYDKDPLKYVWKDDKGAILGNGIQAVIRFDKPGRYPVKLVVLDNKGVTGIKDTMISVGNAMPDVELQVSNRSFYWDTIRYAVSVSDEEDGGLGNGIKPNKVHVTLQYLPRGSSLNGQGVSIHSKGEVLMNESDCKGCHQMSSRSVGPSFEDVAAKYRGKEVEIPRLAQKILIGGSGVWGNATMSPHPQLNTDQTTEIVKYIFSLVQKNIPPQKLPVKGEWLIPGRNDLSQQQGYYLLSANYTDRGGDIIGPLTAYSTVALRNPTIQAADFDQVYDSKISDGSLNGLNNSYGMVKDLDLITIRQVMISARGSGGIEIHLDSARGSLIGRVFFDTNNSWNVLMANLKQVNGRHDVYFVFVNKEYRFKGISLQWARFDNQAEDPSGMGKPEK